MTFTAHLRRHSRIWHAWTHRHAVSGNIAGVPFRWVSGGDFVAENLSAGQVAALRGEPDVRLEMFGAEAAEPVAPPADPDDDDDGQDMTQEQQERITRSGGIPHTPGWRKRMREAQRGTG